MGSIRVHEFISLDGVIDEPTWTFEYGFDPKMGEAIGGAMASCQGILLGRATYEMFEPAWSARTAAEDPGAPFMNDTMKYVVSVHAGAGDVAELRDRRAVRRRRHPQAQGARARRHLRQRQRHTGAGHAR